MLLDWFSRGEIVMELVHAKQRGTTARFMGVRLVICATIVGLAELFAQEAHAARSYLYMEPGALLRDRDVAKNSPRAPLRRARWLVLTTLGTLLGAVCPSLLFSPSAAQGAGEESWEGSRQESSVTLAESIYRLPVY